MRIFLVRLWFSIAIKIFIFAWQDLYATTVLLVQKSLLYHSCLTEFTFIDLLTKNTFVEKIRSILIYQVRTKSFTGLEQNIFWLKVYRSKYFVRHNFYRLLKVSSFDSGKFCPIMYSDHRHLFFSFCYFLKLRSYMIYLSCSTRPKCENLMSIKL